MPLITNQIAYPIQEEALIKEKLEDPDFKHSDWSTDDLQALRSSIRAFYRNEQTGICAYCKNDVSLIAAGNAHIEHIAPKSIHLNFIFEPKNLCVVCADCNTIKRNQEVLNEVTDTFVNQVIRYPRSSNAFKIVHPHFDEYDDHILIMRRLYIDKSPKGNFTIGACKLNRYIHQFGVDDDYVDDDELTTVMNDFMDGKNSIQKTRALNKLMDMLLNT